MSGSGYAIIAYVIGLGLLWGYAATLWISSRRVVNRKAVDGGAS